MERRERALIKKLERIDKNYNEAIAFSEKLKIDYSKVIEPRIKPALESYEAALKRGGWIK